MGFAELLCSFMNSVGSKSRAESQPHRNLASGRAACIPACARGGSGMQIGYVREQPPPVLTQIGGSMLGRPSALRRTLASLSRRAIRPLPRVDPTQRAIGRRCR
jgi:hypothetical protein